MPGRFLGGVSFDRAFCRRYSQIQMLSLWGSQEVFLLQLFLQVVQVPTVSLADSQHCEIVF